MGPFRARSSINSPNVRWRASNICKSFSQSISHIRRQIWWNGGRNLWDNFAIKDLFLFVDVYFQLKPLCLFRNNCTFLLLNFKSRHSDGELVGARRETTIRSCLRFWNDLGFQSRFRGYPTFYLLRTGERLLCTKHLTGTTVHRYVPSCVIIRA